MKFCEIADFIIDILGEIHHSTYISVILYNKGHIDKIKSNNYNNWQNIMFDGKLHNDCLLFKIADNFNNILPHQEDIIVWDNVVDESDSIHRMRLEHGLHNGISVIIKKENDIAWCISACNDKSQSRDFFHAKFHSKRPRIKEAIGDLMFTKNYSTQEQHIDFQGIMDGLYYPFYMEWCRHDFLKERLDIDIVKEAERNNIYILTEYNIKFKKPIKPKSHLVVTCELTYSDKKSRFSFLQTIVVEDKIHAEAQFEATCIPSSGRPCIPDKISIYLLNKSTVPNTIKNTK